MLSVAWSHNYRALIIQELRDRLFSCTRSGKPTIEDVSLPLDLAGDGFNAHGDADDSVGKRDSLQMRSDQSHPRLVARRRASRPHQMLERLAICQRENHHHLTRALSA